jgi:hypothetical protein
MAQTFDFLAEENLCFVVKQSFGLTISKLGWLQSSLKGINK